MDERNKIKVLLELSCHGNEEKLREMNVCSNYRFKTLSFMAPGDYTNSLLKCAGTEGDVFIFHFYFDPYILGWYISSHRFCSFSGAGNKNIIVFVGQCHSL